MSPVCAEDTADSAELATSQLNTGPRDLIHTAQSQMGYSSNRARALTNLFQLCPDHHMIATSGSRDFGVNEERSSETSHVFRTAWSYQINIIPRSGGVNADLFWANPPDVAPKTTNLLLPNPATFEMAARPHGASVLSKELLLALYLPTLSPVLDKLKQRHPVASSYRLAYGQNQNSLAPVSTSAGGVLAFRKRPISRWPGICLLSLVRTISRLM